jgi:hypothetical protein
MPKWIFNPFTGKFDAVAEEIGHNFFEATCTGAESLYDLVYVIQTGPIVRTIDIDDLAKMPPIGMIIRLDGTSCTVQTSGEVALSGLDIGEAYWAGVDGQIAPNPPPRPTSGKRFIQVVGVAQDTDLFLLRIDGSPTRIIPL